MQSGWHEHTGRMPATGAPLQQQMRPRHLSAQFFAKTARNTATSLTGVGAAGAWFTEEAPSSTSIAAYAVPLMRGGAPPDIMRPAQAGGAFVVALAACNPTRGGTSCHFSRSPPTPAERLGHTTQAARSRPAFAPPPPVMSPRRCSAALLRRRHLFRPRHRSVECNSPGDAWIPLGSLQEYNPADFARLVEAVVTLNLREAAANLATLLIES